MTSVTAYEGLFRTVFTRMDAENAHGLAFRGMRAGARVPGAAQRGWKRLAPADPSLSVDAFGLHFPGPLGVAAGFDKNATGIDALGALGFAFVEVGTVTARPQPGNPRPRLHRLVDDQAIVNRMGFNNDGAAAVAARLSRRRRRRTSLPMVVGVNIGKSKATPEHRAVADYEAATRLLAPYADYLVINVSSPNTPGLRDLQAVDRLGPLLDAVRAQADRATARRVPLLVKIAPDLSDDDVVAVGEMAVARGLDGIVATNTTVARENLLSLGSQIEEAGAGGLSGRPLRARSTQVLSLLRTTVGDDLTLVSVGGIDTGRDVYERLVAGASLVQGYTGFVYGGPAWPSRVHRELASLLMGEQ